MTVMFPGMVKVATSGNGSYRVATIGASIGEITNSASRRKEKL